MAAQRDDYSPGNYVWSSAFTLALMAGGQPNQTDRWLAPLRDIGPEPDTDAWTKTWDSMGEEQSRPEAAELTAALRLKLAVPQH